MSSAGSSSVVDLDLLSRESSSEDEETNNALRGYRILFLRRLTYSDSDEQYRRSGADLLYMETPMPTSEDEFNAWWRQEVATASNDGLTMVVLKTWPDVPNHKRWLNNIEEEEWYESVSGQGTVRYTTHERLQKTMAEGAAVTDMWDDEIERGGIVGDESSASTSEAEFEG